MSVLAVQCHNCGAKYKLPESFDKPHAKCKQCGATIDVAAQRAAAAAPPAPTPTAVPKSRPTPSAAVPPTAASTPRSAASRREKAAEPEPTVPAGRTGRATAGSSARASGAGASGRAGRTRGDAAAAETGRRGRTVEAKSSNKAVVFGGIGLLAVAVVVVVFVMSGDAPDTGDTANQGAAANAGAAASQTDTAKAPSNPAPTPTPTPETTPKTSPTEDPAAANAPKSTDPATAEPKEAAAAKTEPAPAAEKPAPKPEPSTKPDAPAGPTITSKDQVFDPRKELQPVPLADDVTDEERTNLAELLKSVEEGGLAGQRAKRTLESMGHKALAPIVNRLREIDYTDSSQSMFAYELNRSLESMLITVNAGFRPMLVGEDVNLDNAHYNAQTVKAWQRAVEKWGTKEAFAEHIKKMRQRDKTVDDR